MFVNMHEAAGDLAQLVNAMLAGEDVVIVRDGEPVARLVPVRPERVPGTARGLIRVAADFNAPLPDDILKAFEPA